MCERPAREEEEDSGLGEGALPVRSVGRGYDPCMHGLARVWGLGEWRGLRTI